MVLRMKITEARQNFLKLADTLEPNDCIEVERNAEAVLRITKVSCDAASSPYDIIRLVLNELPKPGKKVPRNLSSRYKQYLYGKAK